MRARRTLVDYLTRTRARPVTWPAIAKDVCGTAKSVRDGRSAEKERIEARSGGREGGSEVGTEEEILDRGYRLGSRDRRCSSSTCPKAFGARSFRLVLYRSRSFRMFSAIGSFCHGSGREVLTGSTKGGFSRHRRRDRDARVDGALIVVEGFGGGGEDRRFVCALESVGPVRHFGALKRGRRDVTSSETRK